ncbi:MAG: hypothetical protein EXQ88_03495 [Alphaproteobacteria bacterium]|nr:hypothetical protein [Alphaproteobacteria bacterium]
MHASPSTVVHAAQPKTEPTHWLDWTHDQLGKPRVVLLGLGLYLFLRALLPSILYQGANADISQELLFAQEWRLGYGFSNPPLHTWLLKLAQLAFGPSLATVYFLKAAFLWILAALLLVAGRAIGLTPAIAGLAALSVIGMRYAAFDSLQNLTHSILLLPLCVLAVLSFIRLDRSGSLASYLALGVVAGLGLLAKYNFGVLMLGLIAAALLDPGLRARVLNWRCALVILVAGAIYAPHGLWQLDNLQHIGQLTEGRFVTPNTKKNLSAILEILAKVPLNALATTLPFSALLLLCAPAILRAPKGADDLARWRRLIARSLLATVGILLAAALVLVTTNIRTRYFIILIPVPLYLLARAQAAGVSPRALARCAVILLLLAVAIPAAQVREFAFSAQSGESSANKIPVARIAAQLRLAGFSRGTLVAETELLDLVGNLVPYFPKARLISPRRTEFVPAAHVDGGTCLLMWDLDAKGASRRSVLNVLAALNGGTAALGMTPATIAIERERAPGSPLRFQYILLPEGAGDCA